MTMTLQYNKEMFQLSENYSETYTIPVCILTRKKFEIFFNLYIVPPHNAEFCASF